MPGALLTTLSNIQCPHGGVVILAATTDTVAQIGGGYVLLESDIHPVAGCPFMTGTNPSPCTTVLWSGGSTQVKVNQIGVLTASSVGQCLGPSGVQGTAIIGNTQTLATATA